MVLATGIEPVAFPMSRGRATAAPREPLVVGIQRRLVSINAGTKASPPLKPDPLSKKTPEAGGASGGSLTEI